MATTGKRDRSMGGRPWSPGRLKTLAAALSLILGALLCGVEVASASDSAAAADVAHTVQIGGEAGLLLRAP